VKSALLQSVMGGLVLPLLLAPAASGQPSSEPVVVVQGAATVRHVPDMAWVTVGAEHRAKDPKQAQADNAAVMRRVSDRLRALGVPEAAIRTAGYDLQLEFDYRDGRQIPREYVSRTRIEVRVDEVSQVGEILEASVAAGATRVEGLRFDLKARAEAEREALTQAVAAARARARAAAAGAGQSVGRVIRIDDATMQVEPPQPVMMARMAAEDVTLQPPVSPGEIEIRAQVTLTATLVP
jgi:uncharacterized protein YggE